VKQDRGILPFFGNLFKVCSEREPTASQESGEGTPFSVEDFWDAAKEEVEPVFGELKPIPPGFWGDGELLGWLVHTILVVLKASRLFGQVGLQRILEEVRGMDRRTTEEGGGGRCCACPSCSSLVWAYNGADMHHKSFKSIFGYVTLWRHYARCSCGKRFFPLDVALGLGSHKMLPFLQFCSIRLGVYLPHQTASQTLHLLTGIYVSPNTIRARVQEIGKAVLDRQKWDVTPEVERLLEFAASSLGIVDLHAALDGIMAPLNKLPKAAPESHKEVKMACLTIRDAEQRRLGKIVLGRLSAPAVFLRCVECLVTDCRESIPNLHQMFLHADGAIWIEKFAKAHDCLRFILDWYHLKENLWNLSEELGKAMSQHQRQAIKAVEDALWNGRVALAIARLRKMRFTQARMRKVRDDIVRYVRHRKEFIPNYKWLWERSFTIGSGEIEGAAKHVVSNRLKNAGMRWSQDGADATVAARCTILNETWGIDLLGANLN
jgi:hypothetical protein